MALRHLPRTIREIMSTLRRSFGPPGVVFGVVVLPIVLVVALVSAGSSPAGPQPE